MMKKWITAFVIATMLLWPVPSGAHETRYRCVDDDTQSVARGADAAAAEVLSYALNGHARCVVDPQDTGGLASGDKVYVIGGLEAVPESAVRSLGVIERFAGRDRYETLKQVVDYIEILREPDRDVAEAAEWGPFEGPGSFASAGQVRIRTGSQVRVLTDSRWGISVEFWQDATLCGTSHVSVSPTDDPFLWKGEKRLRHLDCSGTVVVAIDPIDNEAFYHLYVTY